VSGGAAITVDGVSKRFRLYHERNQSLKIAVLRGGRARFEEFWALQDVSFDVPAGTTFGLIGENGSGKSTMLKCMAKILRPDTGSIAAVGKISALLELGAGFHPELSGRENVYLNGAILGLSKKQLDARFEGIVDFAGIEQFIDTPVKNYSSGMYVRLGFSVAINVDPDILLIDEVLAVGDAEFQRKCSEKIADFRQQGKTIVIVSHSLPSVRALCDEVALLEHGQLRDLGPAGPIIDHYLADAFRDQDDGSGFVRWGSGEVKIEQVEMLDASGAVVTKAHTGDSVTMRIHYHATEPVRDVQFGTALNNIEGAAVTGPNTRHAGLLCRCLDGRGFVDYRIPRLLLLPGGYHFTVAIYDLAALHAYDHVERALRFDVEAGEPYEEVGVVSLGGAWEGEALSPPDAHQRAG
jgi:ABC-type polysaccharide/polyol phosphate transport system ATPase subunit